MSTAAGARSERAVRWTPQAPQKCRVGDPGRFVLIEGSGGALGELEALSVNRHEEIACAARNRLACPAVA